MSVEVQRTTPFEDLPTGLTIEEAADYLGRNQWLVRKGINAGVIPYRKFGRKVIFIHKNFFRDEDSKRVEDAVVAEHAKRLAKGA